MIDAWWVNDATSALVYDLTIAAIALTIWAVVEGLRGDRWFFLVIPVTYGIGVSAGLPLALFLLARRASSGCARRRTPWLSRQDDCLARRGPRLERAVRLGHLIECKTLVDADFHIARKHLGEQLARHLLAGGVIGDMGEQRRPRDLERALLAQKADIEGRHRTRGIAEGNHEAQGPQAIKRTLEGIAAHRIHHHIDTAPIGQFAHLGDPIAIAVIDASLRPVITRKLAFLFRACRADQADTLAFRPLAGKKPNTTGGGVKQHRVALGNRRGAAEQILGRQTLEHHRRPFLEGDTIGQGADLIGLDHARLAIGTGRHGGIGSAITNLEMGHTRAHSLDHACTFHAHGMGHLQRIKTAALINVDEVQAAGMVTDANLAGARCAHGAVNDLVSLRPAGGLDDNGLCHGCFPPFSPVAEPSGECSGVQPL